ncbi:MAG TPA: sigma-70 family RNA polymerase sigma factor [Terriglobia bacterium]|jgi:RNA polymerase sigma-70 factor (ECF subfamily)|nr:sigma-70 family RNA polymerase sigma factor [Terriglobia bacterium]
MPVAESLPLTKTIPRPAVATRYQRTVYYRRLDKRVEKHDFDAHYVRLLTEGDVSVERHFTSYFGELLRIKLRRRGWAVQDVEDILQETFLRVLQALRQKSSLEHPERLGAFVNSVCNNIILEFWRSRARHDLGDPADHEPVDCAIDMEGSLVAQERKELVRTVLAELPPADQELLRMVFMEEAAREDICRTMNVDRDYLRVLLHRALVRFKSLAARKGALAWI